MKNTLIRIVLGTLVIGLPIFSIVEAKADNHTDMPHGDMEMKQGSDTESEPTLDGGYDGEPVTTIPEIEETVDVTVINKTNAAIDYQAMGFTENQTLEGGEEHTMLELPVPVVIFAARQDDGFITSEPTVNEEGVLEVTFDETDEYNLGVVRIEEDGGVYVARDSETDTPSDE